MWREREKECSLKREGGRGGRECYLEREIGIKNVIWRERWKEWYMEREGERK